MWYEIVLWYWWKAKWLLKMIFWIVPVAIDTFDTYMGPDAVNLYSIGFAFGGGMLIMSFIFAGIAFFGHNQEQLWWLAGELVVLYYLLGFLIDHLSWDSYRMRLFPFVFFRCD
jgi:hypothetical protein